MDLDNLFSWKSPQNDDVDSIQNISSEDLSNTNDVLYNKRLQNISEEMKLKKEQIKN